MSKEMLNYFQVRELGRNLAESIIYRAAGADRFKPWTRAVYSALREIAEHHGWKIYPQNECYKGEYLCDFTLFEEGYGCRLACESQWHHGIREHQTELYWAFEKMRGVKADIKLFIFEGTEEHWTNVQKQYLYRYAQLSTEETFLALRWHTDQFYVSIWQPKHDGVQQSGEVQFELVPIQD